MRNEWYGDKCDLVKWGSLVHLCQQHGIKTIIQVPFLAKQNGCNHMLRFDDGRVGVPLSVWKHFRDIGHIKALGKSAGLKIQVITHEFTHQMRSDYFERVRAVAQSVIQPKVVFLDPDTGIEPNKCRAEHVKLIKIKAIWHCLRARDWLVLYQHARRQWGWRRTQRDRFRKACDGVQVRTYQCPEIAHDVAFFAACKP